MKTRLRSSLQRMVRPGELHAMMVLTILTVVARVAALTLALAVRAPTAILTLVLAATIALRCNTQVERCHDRLGTHVKRPIMYPTIAMH